MANIIDKDMEIDNKSDDESEELERTEAEEILTILEWIGFANADARQWIVNDAFQLYEEITYLTVKGKGNPKIPGTYWSP